MTNNPKHQFNLKAVRLIETIDECTGYGCYDIKFIYKDENRSEPIRVWNEEIAEAICDFFNNEYEFKSGYPYNLLPKIGGLST